MSYSQRSIDHVPPLTHCVRSLPAVQRTSLAEASSAQADVLQDQQDQVTKAAAKFSAELDRYVLATHAHMAEELEVPVSLGWYRISHSVSCSKYLGFCSVITCDLPFSFMLVLCKRLVKFRVWFLNFVSCLRFLKESKQASAQDAREQGTFLLDRGTERCLCAAHYRQELLERARSVAARSALERAAAELDSSVNMKLSPWYVGVCARQMCQSGPQRGLSTIYSKEIALIPAACSHPWVVC